MNMADNDDNEMLAQVPATMLTEGGDQSHTHFKLPPFWQRNPGLWFAQVECVLCVIANRNVSRSSTNTASLWRPCNMILSAWLLTSLNRF